jgi:hypothetical protein
VKAGFSDANILWALRKWRTEHGEDVSKLDRTDYVRRTIATAREKPRNAPPGAIEKQSLLPPPGIIVPSNHFDYSRSANIIFTQFAKRNQMFRQDHTVVECSDAVNGGKRLRPVSPAMLSARVDELGIPVQKYVQYKNEIALVDSRLSKEAASIILESGNTLGLISRVLNSPVIALSKAGVAEVLFSDYYPDHKILILSDKRIPDLPLKDAVMALIELLRDFRFVSTGDMSRALAAMITPALKQGEIIQCPTPMVLVEADRSQTGKGYLLVVYRAIYNEQASLISKKSSSVGKLDEAIDFALLAGKPFIVFDNIRGAIDSQHLEAILTAPGAVQARTPYRPPAEVYPRAFEFQATSNGMTSTEDLTNRLSIIRLLKQDAGYEFQDYPEGDLLAHVEANQSYYLGCVFAVVREWVHQGRPMTKETHHDMRQWCRSVDWIVQNLFEGRPIMDGHDSIKARVSSSATTWLREVCLAIDQDSRTGEQLTASKILELCDDHGIDLPNVKSRKPPEPVHVGRLMKKLYDDVGGECLSVDQFMVTRSVEARSYEYPNSSVTNEVKVYEVTRQRAYNP